MITNKIFWVYWPLLCVWIVILQLQFLLMWCQDLSRFSFRTKTSTPEPFSSTLWLTSMITSLTLPITRRARWFGAYLILQKRSAKDLSLTGVAHCASHSIPKYAYISSWPSYTISKKKVSGLTTPFTCYSRPVSQVLTSADLCSLSIWTAVLPLS